jgi:alpha-tubulin suppressor-like RCC1 family protein
MSMHTLSVRRATSLAATVLLAAVLVPVGLSAPAVADASGGVPGVPRADATALSTGDGFTCVIVGDGSLRCWGQNVNGQLAQGNTNDIGDDPGESTVRVDLGSGRTAVAVTAGNAHACAILDTGELRCWGNNGFGSLGQGNTNQIGDEPGETTVHVDLGVGRTAVAVDAGDYHTCAILDTGDVRCWGRNASGQLSQGNINDIGDNLGETTVPVNLGAGRTAVAVSAGGNSACAILDNGQLRCWGYNAAGMLLQGNFDNIGDNPGETTVPVNLGGQPATAVSVGENHVCAIRSDGQLRCWGASNQGQLGLGQTPSVGDDPGETSIGPVPLPAGRTAVAVTAGFQHTCAILDSGELRCWGDNNYGQLGQGTIADYGDDATEFTLGVSIDAPVRAVGAGHLFTCAVTGTGLRCWGAAGRLGQGSNIPYGASPGQVPSLLPPINLGGQQVGRDTDGDGVRDAVDACPTLPAPTINGCAAPAAPEAVLKGKKVLLDTVLAKKKASSKCPAKATVVVRSKSSKGRINVTKQLKTTTVTGGCRVHGKVNLHAKPKKTAKVKVTVSGAKLKTKHLIAVRP